MGRTKLSVVLIIVCAVKCLAMTYDELEDFAEYLKSTSLLNPTLNTSDQLFVIRNGMEELTRRTCIKFRPHRKGDRDAVVIQGSENGCFSSVGNQGGYQVLNLYARHRAGKGCFRRGTVMHELLHALGFFHMHSSAARDDYVTIVWDNIRQQKRYNFCKYNLTHVSNFGLKYDYTSCLHYSRQAFSSNGQDTIVPKQVDVIIGQRQALTENDAQKVIKMYCDAAKADKVQVDENPPNNNNVISQILSLMYRILG